MAMIGSMLLKMKKERDGYYTTEGTLEVYGGKGNDLIGGKDGDDIIYGEEGDDRVLVKRWERSNIWR